MIGPASQCLTCSRFRSPIGSSRVAPTCAAFAEGIPAEIIENRYDHREPYVTDGGIRWKSDGLEFPGDAFGPGALHRGKSSGQPGEPLRPLGTSADTQSRAAGHDTTPGHDELHHYWVAGPGLAKWEHSPKPWTTLVALLTPHVGPEKAKVYASRWFIEVKGYAAGSDINRVVHGKPPRGNKVGPG